MAKKEILRILHTLPGRVRFAFRETKKDTPDLDKFLAIHGVEEVTFSKITKSLLIVYDKKTTSEKTVFSEIEIRFPHIALQKEKEREEQANDGNLMSNTIIDIARKINRNAGDKMKGYADITSLAPSAFIAMGIRELMRNPLMPKWYDFFWYALNMFYWQSKDNTKNKRT